MELEDEAHVDAAEPAQLVGGHFRDVLPADEHAPGVTGVQPCADVQERGFSL